MPAIFARFVVRTMVCPLLIFGPLNPGNAMGDKINHINAGNVLLLEHIDRLALLLTEDSNQHIGTGDFFLSGGLYVEHGPL